MRAEELRNALVPLVPEVLAADLAAEFTAIRRDVATGTLGGSAPGKFVETLVQILQAIEAGGVFETSPKVDQYLRNLESRTSPLPDGLRICASRMARAMYSLRSKRNIVHKAAIDPSVYDLRLLYAAGQWIVAELLALAPGITSAEAARLVHLVQLPVGELVETLDGRHIVHGDMTVAEEVLVVLLTIHPQSVPGSMVATSMDRRAPASVRKALAAHWKAKLVHREEAGDVVLTQRGLRAAIEVAQRHAANL